MTSTEKLIIIMEHRNSLAMTVGSDLIALGLSLMLCSFVCNE